MAQHETTIDELAVMIAEGFVGQREYMDKKFAQNDEQHRHMQSRLDLIETDLAALRVEIREIRRDLDRMITRTEYERVVKRVTALEKKLGTG